MPSVEEFAGRQSADLSGWPRASPSASAAWPLPRGAEARILAASADMRAGASTYGAADRGSRWRRALDTEASPACRKLPMVHSHGPSSTKAVGANLKTRAGGVFSREVGVG